jgi:hypothetical protein
MPPVKEMDLLNLDDEFDGNFGSAREEEEEPHYIPGEH